MCATQGRYIINVSCNLRYMQIWKERYTQIIIKCKFKKIKKINCLCHTEVPRPEIELTPQQWQQWLNS